MNPTFLTEKQVQDFERDGFLVIKKGFDSEGIAEIITWTNEVQNYPETAGKYMMYFEDSLLQSGDRILQRLENFYPYHKGFRGLFDSDDILGRVSDLFGQPAILFKDKINFKLPGGDGFKWHQDQQAGWSTYADLFITAMVCIDEITNDNGPLALVAGHHKDGLVGKEWAPLTDQEMAGMKFETYNLLPGDMVFFDSFVPHGSSPNMTDKPRRVLYITYNRLADHDHREQYYIDKRKNLPPDCERIPGKEYKFLV